MTDRPTRAVRAGSFDSAAGLYERGRPPYPPAALDWLLPPGARRVLDLGAGTGKLTRQLVARGLDVVAVEPLDGMRAELARVVPGARVLAGSAERIPLADGAVDAVLAAQAWHWVRPGAGGAGGGPGAVPGRHAGPGLERAGRAGALGGRAGPDHRRDPPGRRREDDERGQHERPPAGGPAVRAAGAARRAAGSTRLTRARTARHGGLAQLRHPAAAGRAPGAAGPGAAAGGDASGAGRAAGASACPTSPSAGGAAGPEQTP